MTDGLDGIPFSIIRSILIVAMLMVATCAESESISPIVVCDQAWYRDVEKTLKISDAEGHGPDLGSDEWKSAVEFKLGIRGAKDVPQRSGTTWCEYIDQLLRDKEGV